MPKKPRSLHPFRRATGDREYDRNVRKRDSALLLAKRIRSGARWQKLRLHKLNHDPLCQRCKDVLGLVRCADEVHHVIPIRVDPERAYDLENLRSLCKRCHQIEEVGDATGGRSNS